AITGAVQLEDLLVPVSGALHHRGDECAAKPLKSSMVEARFVGGDEDILAFLLRYDTFGHHLLQLALGALYVDSGASEVHGHALGDVDRTLPDAGETEFSFSAHYHTSHRSSPPTLRLRASRSVIRP